jgi:hypothetical protein
MCTLIKWNCFVYINRSGGKPYMTVEQIIQFLNDVSVIIAMSMSNISSLPSHARIIRVGWNLFVADYTQCC